MAEAILRLRDNVPAFHWNAGTRRWEVEKKVPPGVSEQAVHSGDIRIPKDPDDPDGESIPCSIFVVPKNPAWPVPSYLGNSQWAQRAPMEAPSISEVESSKSDVTVQTSSTIARIAKRIANN